MAILSRQKAGDLWQNCRAVKAPCPPKGELRLEIFKVMDRVIGLMKYDMLDDR